MSNELQRKNEIQKELQVLSKSIQDLTKRREKLISDRTFLTNSIEKQTRAISEAMLEDRDTTKAAEALARDKATLEGLTEAIALGDQRLADLKNQQSENEKYLILVDVNALSDEASNLFLEIVDQLYKVDSSLSNLEAKFAAIHAAGAPAGFSIDSDDRLRNLRAMYSYLRGDASATDLISYKLKQIETSYKADLLIARNKRGK